MDYTSTFLKLINVDEVRVWRVSLRARILCAVMGALMLGLTAYVLSGAIDDVASPAGVALILFLICDVIVFRLVRYAFGSVTAARPDGLVIGTGRLRRSRRKVVVPWQVIDSCKPGTDGITIDCSDGRRVLSAVPQRTPSGRGTHRKTDADYFALYVMERARLIRQVSAGSTAA
jgi:hypothetical protein